MSGEKPGAQVTVLESRPCGKQPGLWSSWQDRCLSTGSCLSFQVADEPHWRAEVTSVGLQDLSWEA